MGYENHTSNMFKKMCYLHIQIYDIYTVQRYSKHNLTASSLEDQHYTLSMFSETGFNMQIQVWIYWIDNQSVS